MEVLLNVDLYGNIWHQSELLLYFQIKQHKMKFLKKGKLILYSNNDANEFAIKKGSEVEFKAILSNSAKYTEVIAELKIGSEGLTDLSWDQILSRWISWHNNINEKVYKFLKSL